MALPEETNFFERVEDLCKCIADSIPGNASTGSVKERLLKLADEAAGYQVELSPLQSRDSRHGKKAIIDLDALEELLVR